MIQCNVFESFKDETGNFKKSLCEDVKGLLSLYEASFFGLDGETIIDEAKIFTTANLKNIKGDTSPSVVRKVGHALDMPLHWRLTRVEARWFIETCEQEQNMNPILLEFAKLDYNTCSLFIKRRLAIWQGINMVLNTQISLWVLMIFNF
ncbi:hypothetical protein ACSBR1_012365 [Camellia fascicularis]